MLFSRTQSSQRKQVASSPAFGTALKGALVSTEALANHSKEEIATIGTYLEPFMAKLGVLSEEYETEKAALEREMFETMRNGSQNTAVEIVEQRASARHYVNIVNEFFKITEDIVIEGIQARRAAEQRFTSSLLEATQQEYEHVILAMRSEDRKKAIYDRQENAKKLDNCRTAVRLDLAATLLQQRSVFDRKRENEIRELQAGFAEITAGFEEQIRYLEGEVASANNVRRHAELELNLQLGKMKQEVNEYKEDLKIVQTERDFLESELKARDEMVLKLTEEADVARDELHSAQKNFEDEIKDLQRRLNRKDDEMQRKEARLLKRCEEMTVEIGAKTSENEELRTKNHELTLHRDELQENMQNAHQKFSEEAEVLEQERLRHQKEAESMAKVAEELQHEIHTKEASIRKLHSQLTEEADKVDRVEAQLKTVDDERATVRRLFNEMRCEVHVWLLDQIYLRKQFSIDPGFDGSDASVTNYHEDFADVEHRDLQALHHIMQGAFKGTYAEAHERHIVEKMMQAYFAERIQQLEVALPGPGKPASDTVQQEKGSVPRPGSAIEDLNEAERVRVWNERTRVLEEEHEATVKQVTAEWRAKSISLAQRLAKTEAELGLPRTEDVERIKTLEGQVRALLMTIDGMGGAKNAKGEKIAAYEELNRWAQVPKREGVMDRARIKPLEKIVKGRGSSHNLRANSAEPTFPLPRRSNTVAKDMLSAAKKGSMRLVI